MEEYECKACGEPAPLDDLYKGLCGMCQDQQEIDFLRSH